MVGGMVEEEWGDGGGGVGVWGVGWGRCGWGRGEGGVCEVEKVGLSENGGV